MASGAAGMAALSKRISAIPDDSVQALVRWFVPRSEQIGGRFKLYGHDKALTSRIRTRSSRGKMASTVLAGTPATGWSIKSYGRRGGYTVHTRTKQALSIGGVSSGLAFDNVRIDRATSGDHRWDKLVDEANAKFPDVIAELIDSVVRF